MSNADSHTSVVTSNGPNFCLHSPPRPDIYGTLDDGVNAGTSPQYGAWQLQWWCRLL